MLIVSFRPSTHEYIWCGDHRGLNDEIEMREWYCDSGSTQEAHFPKVPPSWPFETAPVESPVRESEVVLVGQLIPLRNTNCLVRKSSMPEQVLVPVAV